MNVVDLVRKLLVGAPVLDEPPPEGHEREHWRRGIYSRLDRAQAEIQAVRESIRVQAEADRRQHPEYGG